MSTKARFKTAAELAAAPADEVARERAAAWARMDYIYRAADGQVPTADAQREYDALERLLADLDALPQAKAVNRSGLGAMFGTGEHDENAAQRWTRASDGLPATVGRGEKFAAHPVVARAARQQADQDAAIIGAHGGLGRQIRAAVTTSSGSAIVPTLWTGDIIDRARNFSAVMRAGAQVVPMDAKIVQIGRLTGDPTAAFRAEGGTITASDPTFDSVQLSASTMSCLVVGSLEWFQDADDADQVVTDAIAKSVATQLDLVALFGGMTAGNEGFNLASPPNPRGILGTLLAVASTSVLGAATNGTAQTTGSFWNEVLDTIYTVRDWNEQPNALIWSSRLARQYAKAYDTTGQPLATPQDVLDLQRFVSNQIPSFTSGTMTSRATDLFAGDFSQVIVGQRLGFTIQPLTERYAENGQVGIVAHWRGDVQLARPRAFAVYRYLQGA